MRCCKPEDLSNHRDVNVDRQHGAIENSAPLCDDVRP
jgi:hypothetical protein